MATAGLNPAERVNVSRGNDSTGKADESRTTTTSRRQTECYQFRAADLLHYAFSVSFFFVNLATGEQRIYQHIICAYRVSHDSRLESSEMILRQIYFVTLMTLG